MFRLPLEMRGGCVFWEVVLIKIRDQVSASESYSPVLVDTLAGVCAKRGLCWVLGVASGLIRADGDGSFPQLDALFTALRFGLQLKDSCLDISIINSVGPIVLPGLYLLV